MACTYSIWNRVFLNWKKQQKISRDPYFLFAKCDNFGEALCNNKISFSQSQFLMLASLNGKGSLDILTVIMLPMDQSDHKRQGPLLYQLLYRKWFWNLNLINLSDNNLHNPLKICKNLFLGCSRQLRNFDMDCLLLSQILLSCS